MRLFGIGSEEIGRFAIPGEAELDLPAGKVKLRYQHRRESMQKTPMGLPEFDVSVVAVDGGEELTVRPPRGSTGGSGGKLQTMPVGSVEVPDAGRYRVAVANRVQRTEPHLIVLS